jgi:hypothetical protein
VEGANHPKTDSCAYLPARWTGVPFYLTRVVTLWPLRAASFTSLGTSRQGFVSARSETAGCASSSLGLLQSWNVACCTPPLPAADIERIVNSIAGKELRRRGNE